MEEEWRKGPWTVEEDRLLLEYVKLHGEGKWNAVARLAAGLRRNGKSCRLRWVNYLRPDLKRGRITPYEESIIVDLHATWGNRWSTIARSLPGRTDNEIKNYWRTHFKKKGQPCSQNTDKLKARLLKRQHEFQQQQKQQEENDIDMKKTVSLYYEQSTSVETSHELVEPEAFVEKEVLLPFALYDLSICDGLWSMDDFHGNNNSINLAIYHYTLANSHFY